MTKRWHAVKTSLPQTECELAMHLLHELGCNGAVEEPEANENWVRLTAYFDASGRGRDSLQRRIKSTFAPFPLLANARFEIVTSALDDWSHGWKQWFRPFAIVPGITVTPSWENYSPSKKESVITLDPGMAFGTGLHPTTKLCARTIWKTVQKGAASLLDVGTGSGLLALVGRKLGIERIVAVETDTDARSVAQENLATNDADDIRIADSLTQVTGEFDMVVANIQLNTLVHLSGELIGHTSKDGRLVLSGITPDQEADIRPAFPLHLADIEHEGDWSLLTFINKD